MRAAGPNSPPRCRTAGDERAPDPTRPSQRRKAPPPGKLSRRPHSTQRRLARAHAVGPVQGPPCPHHRCPGHTGNRSWPPAPREGQPGGGQRLTPDAPHNGGRPAPLGRPPTTPAARSAAQGMQAKGKLLGPHARTPAPTASGYRTPTVCPEDGQPGEEERLTSDAPHIGARHPPRGRAPATTTARNAGSQERALWGRCRVPHTHTTRARDTRATGPGCPPPELSSWERDSACHQTPLTKVEGHPPPERPPTTPAARSPLQDMPAKGTVLGPHARTPAPTARR